MRVTEAAGRQAAAAHPELLAGFGADPSHGLCATAWHPQEHARRVTTKAIVRPRLCGVHPRHQRRLAGPYVEVAATTNSVAAAGMRAAARRPVRGVGGRADLGRDKPSPISAGQA